MKKRVVLLLMYICSFMCSMAPLVVYVAINHEKYIGVRADALKLSAGGLICAALVLFKILGKLKAPSSTVCLGIFFILSYLLKSITDDLIVLSFLEQSIFSSLHKNVSVVPMLNTAADFFLGGTQEL